MNRPPPLTEMDRFSSVVALLSERAASRPNDRAYVFVSDRGAEEGALTYGELHGAARALAVRLLTSARPGDRAVLVFPPGLEFMVAFFGCLIAGIIAVPMMMPRRNGARDASAAILANCEPVLALTTSALALRGDVQARFERDALRWLTVDLEALTSERANLPLPAPQDIAFLQYTSGSTSEPKGVAVSHANLLANLEMIRLALGNTSRSTYVNWVPLYHDMGLILNALQALYLGAPCVLMAPNGFMQRPLNWLRAIHHYKAEVAGSPNFGYDLCVSRYRAEQMEGVDLSSWKIALQRRRARPRRDDPAVHRDIRPPRLQARSVSSRLRHGRGDAADLGRPPRRGPHGARRSSQAALQAHRVAPPRRAGRRADRGRLRPRSARRTDRDRRSRHATAARRPIASAKSGSTGRTSRASIGATRPRPRPACTRGSKARTPPHRGCAPATSAFSTRRRVVRHRADQGTDHHPRHQSLSAGHRADRAAPARVASPERRCGILRRRRTRRRDARRSSRRSSAPSATGSIRKN